MGKIFAVSVAVFSVLFVHVHGEQGDDCSKGPIRACGISLLTQLAVLRNIVPDEQFLKQNCSLIIAELQCLSNYETYCDFPSEKKFYPFRKAYELKMFARDLCNENSLLRKEYLDHADCVNNYSDDVRQVAVTASDEVDEFWKAYVEENPTEYTQEMHRVLGCIFMTLMEYSETTYISWLCGEKTKNMAWNIYYYIVKPTEMICSESDKTYERYAKLFEEYHSAKSSASSISFFLSFSRISQIFQEILKLYVI